MDSTVLLRMRRQYVRGKPRMEEILRGSIVVVQRYCGKASCRCQKGFKHRSLYLSQSNKGKTRMVYIPKRSEKDVQRFIRNYHTLKAVMEKISCINMRLVTRPHQKTR